MQSRSRRIAGVVFGMGVAVLLAAPNASADIVPSGTRFIDFKMVLRAGSFDDYCEHRRTVAKGDTFEALAKSAYGDAARAKEIAAANPTLEADRLPVGAKVVLPPKLAPPKDAKETLAWTFWGHANLSGYFALQRVYPDEEFDPNSVYFSLLAVPSEKVAEFEKLLEAAQQKQPKAGGRWAEEVQKSAPWAIPVKGLHLSKSVNERSSAAVSVTTFRIAELASGPNPPGRFVVKQESVEYRDRSGNVVKAGFDLLLSWRGIPLGLIALLGAIGLARMRRQCAARS